MAKILPDNSCQPGFNKAQRYRENPLKQLTTIEISKEYLHFSAAHFTIFSATERERLHGHNFRLAVSFTAPVSEVGLCFDYNIIKKQLRTLCDDLDEYVLMPANSPYLIIEQCDQHYQISFNGSSMQLPVDEVKILPVRNISVEELSAYFLDQVLGDEVLMSPFGIQAIEIKVASGDRQWGSSRWQREA